MSVFELEPQPDVMGAYLTWGWSIDADGAWHEPSEDLARGGSPSAARPNAARVGLNRPSPLGPCRERSHAASGRPGRATKSSQLKEDRRA